MSEVLSAAPPEPTKEKKVKKSTLVDQGLRGNLATAEIVASVLESFPEATEKSIRNLISVRRSRLKKSISLQG